MPDYLSLSDVDECVADTDDCDHTCTNTEGSFTCSCQSGFSLDSDGGTCIGQPLPYMCTFYYSQRDVHVVMV